jgi:hypothetical protein
MSNLLFDRIIKNTFKVSFLTVSACIFTSVQSSNAQRLEIPDPSGRSIWKVLDDQDYCNRFYSEDRRIGNRIVLRGGHSPGAKSGSLHNRCRYAYILPVSRTRSGSRSQGSSGSLGSTVSGEIGGVVGKVGGSTSGTLGSSSDRTNGNSRTTEDNSREYLVYASISPGSACRFQQGSSYGKVIDGFIYCRHNK